MEMEIMKRINSEQMVRELKRISLRFPLTLMFILSLTGWQLYVDASTWQFEPLYIVFHLGIILSATSQLFYEHFFKKKPKLRLLLYGTVLVFVGLYYFYLMNSYFVIDDPWQFYSIPGIRTMILFFVIQILFIWVPTLKTNFNFSDTFLVTFKAYFIASFFSIILYLGIFSVFMLFEFLFFSLGFEWLLNLSILIFQCFAPILFIRFIPEYDALDSNQATSQNTTQSPFDIPKFLHHLISYILIPVMTVLTGIIVVYILTNITGNFFRENMLEGLLLSYAISGWILLILSEAIDNKIAQTFRKIFPIALIFVIILQMVSTFLQIQEVGVTHGRYIILMFGVGSIISAIWYIFKKNRLQILPIVAMVLGLISLIPPIDALTISVNQQRGRINDVLNKYEMLVDSDEVVPNSEVSEEDQEVIQDSLNYLSEIHALNQLEWLPEEYYYREDEYLGFVSKRDPWEQDRMDREELNQTYVFLSEDYPVIPVGDFEQMFDLSLSNGDDFIEFVEMNEEVHSIRVDLEDGFLIEMDADSFEEPLEFDFSYVLDEFEGKTNQSLSREDLTFTEEVDDYQVQIVVEYLDISGDYLQIDFYLLF